MNKSSFGLFLFGLITGAVIMIFLYNPKYQGKTAKEWADDANGWKKNYNDVQAGIKACEKDPNSSDCLTAQILEGVFVPTPQPSPAPIIIYKTQYVESPAQNSDSSAMHCRPDYVGGAYCDSDSGVQTHCTSNYAGGFNCQ